MEPVKRAGLRVMVLGKRDLRLVFSYVADFFAFLPRWFFKQWTKNSVQFKHAEKLKQDLAAALTGPCDHRFYQSDIVKYQENAKCNKCGMKNKDAIFEAKVRARLLEEN